LTQRKLADRSADEFFQAKDVLKHFHIFAKRFLIHPVNPSQQLERFPKLQIPVKLGSLAEVDAEVLHDGFPVLPGRNSAHPDMPAGGMQGRYNRRFPPARW